MIFHIDANSFYASCERLFRPDLDGKPIAVLSNNDGVTIALNQECKNLGFKRGDIYFKMKDLYKSKKVNVFSSNYTLYADVSFRLNMIYESYSSQVEFYSIDESFLYFPDWENEDFTKLGFEIRRAVWQNTHIPVSVGIAPTKTLAKMCNKLAKDRGGVCNWLEVDKDKELEKYKVGEIWGIGYSKTDFLFSRGIKNALQLKNYPLHSAKKDLSIVGFKTVRELNEIPSLEVSPAENRQNISTSRSFAHKVTDLPQLETALAEYTQLAVSRMRNEKSACQYINVTIMTARAYCKEDKEKEFFNGVTAKLPRYTSFLPEILGTGIKLLHHLYRVGYDYRKIMVTLLDLQPDKFVQTELFEPDLLDQKKKKESIMQVYDFINSKYGRGVLHTGVRNNTTDLTESGANADWITNRKYLSPEYTTNFLELPTVM